MFTNHSRAEVSPAISEHRVVTKGDWEGCKAHHSSTKATKAFRRLNLLVDGHLNGETRFGCTYRNIRILGRVCGGVVLYGSRPRSGTAALCMRRSIVVSYVELLRLYSCDCA